MRRLRHALLLALLPALALAARGERVPGSHEHQHDHEREHRATSTRSFADTERWSAVFDDPDRDAWQKPAEITAVLGLKEGMTIADIGAGTGYFERYFSAAVGESGQVFAVDTEPNMVAHLRARAVEENTPNVVPLLAAPDDPRLPAASVDIVFLCDTYHHIGDRVEYIRGLERVLKPGGTVAVVDFKKKPLPVGPPPEHKLSREAIVAEFAEAGWSLINESGILPYQNFLIFAPPGGTASPESREDR